MRKSIMVILIVFLSVLLCACSDKKEKPEYWLNQAGQLWNGQEYSHPEKAITYFSKAIELGDKNYETYNKRATAYYNMGQYRKAIEDTDKAIRLKPDYVSAYNNRGNAYANLGEYREAIDSYSKVLDKSPNNTEVYNNRGLLYLLQGKKEQGCRDLKKACELNNCDRLKEAQVKGYCPYPPGK